MNDYNIRSKLTPSAVHTKGMGNLVCYEVNLTLH
jgi:hypothetical protein